MESQDLLSAALDECGLDLGVEVPQIQPQIQYLNAAALQQHIGNNLALNKNFNYIQIRTSKNLNFVQSPINSLLGRKIETYKARLPNTTTITAQNVFHAAPAPAATSTSTSTSYRPFEHVKFQNNASTTVPYSQKLPELTDTVIDEEEEEVFQADTYADYMPSKLKLGNRHPDPVVETSSMSSVLPPDIWYRLSIPEEIIDEGKLSALQLESIVYASQQHEIFLPDGSRAGFLIGDGAGVGKGRTVAGIIYENYLMGRKKAIWLSVSNDLKYDAERDLRDIGAKKIGVYPLNKFKYAKISAKENGNVKKGVVFATYSSLISESHTTTSKYKSRFKQLLQWCGDNFDGVIVFDECHKAKNLCPSSGTAKATKTGLTVLELQRKLPKARIVYASATGATEPRNMAYMVRLGLWGEGTPFPQFSDFIQTVEKRGVGAMELVAIDMKLRGTYIARQLSFSGVQFRIEEIPLSKKFVKLYDECVGLWVEAKNKFEKALELMEDDNQIKKAVWGQFWASHQRFFKYLCIAAKVKYAVNLAREALRDGKSVVIGLQSTGESKTLETLEECGGELNDFVSTAKAVFQSLVEKHFPAPNRKKTLRLLGLDTSFFDDLGIKFARNSSNEIVGVKSEAGPSKSKMSSGNKKARKSQQDTNKSIWNDDSDDDSDNKSGSDFKHSGSEEDSDESSGVDEKDSSFDNDSDNSDVEPWDLYEQGKLTKSRKRKKKSKPVKKAKIIKRKKTKYDVDNKLNNIKAEFMSERAGEICEQLREELLSRFDSFSDKLPPNTLDEIIDELGGSENVAEMTGRKGRVINNDGTVQYESRSENDVPLEVLNLTEKQRFMDGEKHIAIISEAASSGISLHSDKRAKNQSRRVHITIELPWSADRAIQQFGRTHRSNQVTAPEYVFLISNLAGEQRFASIVAKRLESLGALTHGDRRATETRDLSKFNIDNKFGRSALEIVMKSIVRLENPLVPTPEYDGEFFEDCRKGLMGVGLISKEGDLEKEYSQMSKFLNRLLGLDVELQNALFKYFGDTLDAVIKKAKQLGRFDLGIMDLTSEMGKVERLDFKYFLKKHATGAAKIELHTVSVERGMSWEEAQTLWTHCKTAEEGFYVNSNEHMIRKSIMLAVADTTSRSITKHIFRIYKPNTGLQSKTETLSSLRERGKKVTCEEAEKIWQEIHKAAENNCGHILWYGNCRRVTNEQQCDVGLRKKIYHIVSGSVLSIWSTIEQVIPNMQSRLQIVRLKMSDGVRVIGTLIPPNSVDVLQKALSPTPITQPSEETQQPSVQYKPNIVI